MIDQYLTPQETSFEKIRIGKDGDGGYVIANNNLGGYTGLIGLGIKDDNSFEKHFQSLNNCVIQEYDYSIDEPPEKLPNSTFFKTMVTCADDIKHIETLGDRKFLKMDIDGSEWELLKTLDISQFEQIACELHFRHSNPDLSAFEKLSSTHNIIHVHGNACDLNTVMYMTKGGTMARMPTTIEVTYLRKDIGTFSPNQTFYPTPLDMSCDTRADIDMRFYPFLPTTRTL